MTLDQCIEFIKGEIDLASNDEMPDLAGEFMDTLNYLEAYQYDSRNGHPVHP